MLQAMRDRAMGWMGWVIMGLIIVTFALFGLGSYLQDEIVAYVAKVNDVEISPPEVQLAYEQQRERMEQMLGDRFDPSMFDEQQLRKTALDSVIRQQLLVQEAASEGLAVSDSLLAMSIQSIPALQVDGMFSEEKYQQALFQRGMTPAGFEFDTRRVLQAEQLTSGLTQSAFVTDAELDQAYRLQAQKRDFAYLVIPATIFRQNVQITDEQVTEYFDTHSDDFVIPEQLRLSWVELTGDELSKTIEVGEDDLRAYYEGKKESLVSKEQRKAAHILIAVDPDADKEVVEEKRKQADDVLQQIRDDADFAALAKEYSDDPGSASSGGGLGYFARGVMVPEFDEVVFSMDTGAVSEVVRTQFGFHIIKLEDVRAEEIPTLEALRDQLVAELQQQSVDDLFYEQLEQLTDLAYENPESLQAIGDEMGLEVRTSDWVSEQGGPGVGQYPGVVAVAFSEDVLEQGNNSEPLEVGPLSVVVVRVEERESAKPAALEAVREGIVETLMKQAAQEQAQARGLELLKEVEQGTSLQELQDDEALVFKKAEGVERSVTGYDPELVAEIFRLVRPVDGAPIQQGVELSNGDYAVVQLTGVEDGDPANMPEDVREQMRSGLEDLQRSAVLATLVQNLRDRADIVIPQDSE